MKTILFLIILLSASLSVAQPKDTAAVDTFIDVTEAPRMIDTLWKIVKYPDLALRLEVEGKMFLSAFINKAGTVDKVEVEKGSDSLFVESAVTAIKKARFSPALGIQHEPVAIWWTVPVVFKLPH
ncbi:MAG TPA: energy transducer TonB [Candidatus Kapabacteria bacterium]|nr:energy transducer TonB [Candidatus Kapabacteria bacterium]